ncbi:MAG: tryptophan synthase subunit alpha [Bacteroidales bacterium]|nr:tryptophan synthase subunit alpha [Candidatus Liminaster caballi]
MNRINQLFQNQEGKLLSIYFCAGAPTLDGTADVIRTLEQKGISMIEVGVPFSDPMADGPVIQDAATKALRNGMSLRLLFDQLKDIRKPQGDRPAVQIPLILMGYMNPVMQFGFENFCKRCVEVGIDGMILPDLPFKDYMEDYKPIADRYDLRIIMLITPETSEERIRFIDDNTDGFIYMVSSAAITGAQKEFNEAKQAYFNKVRDMHLKHPTMIGFGISNKQTLESAQANANGAIIGSKFVQLLDAAEGDASVAIDQLYDALKK